MKKDLIAVIGIALIPIVMIGIYFLMVISGAIFLFNPNPPKPEITYGEFPCRITYELNGEKKVIEDVIICEFDGFENLGSAGKYRKWKSRLKSGNERLILLKINETSELYCSYGSGEYYMDDLRYQTREEYEKFRESNFETYFITFGNLDQGEFKSSSVSVDEALKKYNLRILDIQFAKPIENSFK